MKLSIFSKRMILSISAASALFLAASCKSTQFTIDESMTAQELIQHGQDAYQNGKYKIALKYYQAVIDDPQCTDSSYVEARYEIGHLYMKKKNYKFARPIFEEIQEMFRNTLPGALPAAYNKLAEIELAKIPNTKQAVEAAKLKAQQKQEQETVEEADEY